MSTKWARTLANHKSKTSTSQTHVRISATGKFLEADGEMAIAHLRRRW